MIPACCRTTNSAAHFRMMLWFGIVTLGLLLSSCNMPSAQPTTDSGVGYIQTIAAQTVAVRLTEQGSAPTQTVVDTPVPPTATGSAGNNPTSEPPTATPTQPPAATETSSVSSCDQARFIRDISIPDGTTLTPGQNFQKTWRLRNSGTCPWNTGYSIIFSQGDAMSAPASVSIPSSVPAGETVDVTVAMVAPQEVGPYRGEWLLRNDKGQVFGLGDQAKPFWIEINVATRRGTMYDFFLQSNEANWFSGTGSAATSGLAFNGSIDNGAGAAVIMENAPLETGGPGEMVLLTIPRRETDGIITGVFAPYTVSAGDHFKANIGLLIPTGDCGAGSVTFRIGYQEDGGGIVYLSDINKACDGKMAAVDIDVSSLIGKTVRFVLTVNTRGEFNEDYAVWDKPRIER